MAGFTVVATPGHTPGHISFWPEADGVLIVGDVLFNLNMFTGRVGLRPSLLCFGHGPPLADGDRFQAYVAGLPAD